MMHVLDYDRALGELLELDDTIRATISREFTRQFPVVVMLNLLPRSRGNR
jgi:hypothetical protein